MAADPEYGGADRPLERRISDLLVRGADASRRHRKLVLGGAALLTALLGTYAALTIGVDTRHTALLDEDLAFWRFYREFAEVFPILDEALLVVVDAETPSRARDAAARLAARLAEDEATFPSVYVPGGDPFFERAALLYLSPEQLEKLTTDLARVQPLLSALSRDPGLGNLATVLQDGIAMAKKEPDLPMDLAAAFDSVSLAADAVLDGRHRAISWTEVLLEGELPGESSRRLIVLEPVFDYQSLLPGRSVIRQVRETAQELGLDEASGVRVRITGNVALNTEEMVLVMRQVVAMGAVSFAAIAAMLAVGLRSARVVLCILVTLLVGLVWTLAFAAFAVGHLNVISVAFTILFLGLGVDFGLHFAMRHAELVRSGESHELALREAAASVGSSLALCAGTTAIGFYVFLPTDFRAVGELGLIAGTGMLVSLLCTTTVLPALLSLGDVGSVGREWGGARVLVRALIHLGVTRARAVRLAALAVGLASLALVPSVRFDHNVVEMRDPSTESVQTFNELLAESHTSPWTIDLMEPDLARAKERARALEELPVVERAVTLADYVPEDQEQKLEILSDLAFFLPEVPDERFREPSSLRDQIAALRALRDALDSPWLRDGDLRRRESALRAEQRLESLLARLETLERSEEVETLERFEASLTGELDSELRRLWGAIEPEPITMEMLPADLARRMVAPDGRARVEVLPSEDLADNRAHARFVDGVRQVAPHATGSAVTLLEWGRTVVRSFQQALVSATLAIALLLWLLWRSTRDMLLVLLPLGLASLATAAAAGLLDIAFNFANVVVIPLLLGIGVDSGIHLVHRHRVALVRHPDQPVGELDLLATSSAQAVFWSATTTMLSFGSLALVSHPGIRSLGELLVIGVTLTVLANLVVLPALLVGRRQGAGSAGV